MHAHGVEVLDGAHDDAVAGAVAHDLHLVLFPALDALLHQHLAGRRQLQALAHDLVQLGRVVRDAAARAAQRERGAQHHGVAELGHDGLGAGDGIGVAGARRLDAKLRHALVELLAVLAALDGLEVAADHLHAVLGQDAGARELDGRVEPGLAAQRGQEGVGALLRDDLLDELHGDGFDVGAVGQARVGHDGRGGAVHEHHAIAVGLQHLAGLRARVVELARLPDDDGAASDDEDGLDVFALRHGRPPSLRRTTSRPGDPRRCRCRGSRRGPP